MYSRTYSLIPLKIQKFWKKVEYSNIGNRIATGAFWSLSGSLFSQGLMLLASIIVARILGKTEYGELGMIRSTVNMFIVFAGFGLGLTATKYIAEYKIKDKVKTGKIIGLTTIFAGGTGGIIAIAILISAPFLAEKTINAPHLINEIRLGAVMLFFSALNGSQTGTLNGFEAFKTIAKINIVAGLLAFPIQIWFTLQLGLRGSVIGFGLNIFVLWVLNSIAVSKVSHKFGVKVIYKNSWDEWHVLYKFSLPALLSGLLVSPVMWACNAMLVNQVSGYAELAIFDAANQWRNSILFIPAVLSRIILPILASSQDNKNRFKKIIKINIILNTAISIILATIVSLFAPIIMKSFGSGFVDGNSVLIILSFSTILVSINGVIGQAITGKGKMWVGFIMNFLWATSILLSSYYFIKSNYGALGLAYSFVISYLIHTIWQSIYLFLDKDK